MLKLKRLVKGDLAVNLVRTFVARAIAAMGSLFLLFVVGRHYGPSGVGVLAIAQSLFLGAGLLAKGGMDSALMRYVGENPKSSHVLTYLKWAIKPSILFSVVIASLLFFSRDWLTSLYQADGLHTILWGVALAVPAFVVAYLLSGFFKGVRMPATASLMENGVISLLAGVSILLLIEFLPGVVGLNIIGVAYLIAAYLVLLQGLMQLLLWWRKQFALLPTQKYTTAVPGNITKSQFWSTSQAFFAANLAMFMQNVLAIMLAGWLLNSAELGLFKTAQQLGLLIAFILMVINAIFPPRFASLYKSGDVTRLNRMARIGSAVGIVFVAPLVALCLFFPEWVLAWFGEEFSEAAWMLRIIAIGQLVNVATGSVGFLLSMTGHEKLMRNIALICNAIGLIGFFVFIKLFGVMGAAIALAFVLVSQNITMLVFVWLKLGIWTLPIPNVLAILRIQTTARVNV